MLLEMNGICKDYIQGKMPVRVLADVSLQVEEGDYLAIMGPSGSGKTTLMNIIGCLDVPTGGTYSLNGEDISKLKSDKLAEVRNRTIGFVFQSFYLLPKLSALDNVALPLLYAGVSKAERRTRARAALQAMGLGDREKARPNQLSGGQCQRVAIARAIVTNPKLLLADEPTGALDSASGNQIMDIFDELNAKGVTIIMITHEQEVAARAKRVCHIRDGVISGGMPSYATYSPARKINFEENGFPSGTGENSFSSDAVGGSFFSGAAEDSLSSNAVGESFSSGIGGGSLSSATSVGLGQEIPGAAQETSKPIKDYFGTADEEDIPTNTGAPVWEPSEAETFPESDEAESEMRENEGAPVDFFDQPRELAGHETDLAEAAQDVFASPEAEDAFSASQTGDVFDSPETGDVFGSLETEDVFSASEWAELFDEPETPTAPGQEDTADIASAGNGEGFGEYV